MDIGFTWDLLIFTSFSCCFFFVLVQFSTRDSYITQTLVSTKSAGVWAVMTMAEFNAPALSLCLGERKTSRSWVGGKLDNMSFLSTGWGNVHDFPCGVSHPDRIENLFRRTLFEMLNSTSSKENGEIPPKNSIKLWIFSRKKKNTNSLTSLARKVHPKCH